MIGIVILAQPAQIVASLERAITWLQREIIEIF